MSETIQFSAIVQLQRTIKYLPINERLVAVQIKTLGAFEKDVDEATRAQLRGAITGSTQEMVLTLDNLALLLQGKGYKSEQLHAVSDAFLEDARTKGYVNAVEVHNNHLQTGQWYTRVHNGETLRMVRLDHASHMLFDEQGTVLPTAIPYDYINGHMRDGAYDLKRMVAFFANNTNIRAFDGKGLKVRPVPSYNVSRGCHDTVSFWFAPSQAQMERIWAKAKETNKTYPSTHLHQAVWELDLLGLRAAGIALGDTYWYNGDDGVDENEEDDDD